jgi:hypothetical protein
MSLVIFCVDCRCQRPASRVYGRTGGLQRGRLGWYNLCHACGRLYAALPPAAASVAPGRAAQGARWPGEAVLVTPFERRQPDPLCHAYPGEPFTGAFPCGAHWISSDATGLRGNSLSENLALRHLPAVPGVADGARRPARGAQRADEARAVTAQELRAKAAADLADPKKGVLLEWSWLLAEAEGILREATEYLVHLQARQRDHFERMLASFPPGQLALERFAPHEVSDTMLAEARRMVRNAQEQRTACEQVLRLLERPRKQAADVVPLKPVGDEPRRAAK